MMNMYRKNSARIEADRMKNSRKLIVDRKLSTDKRLRTVDLSVRVDRMRLRARRGPLSRETRPGGKNRLCDTSAGSVPDRGDQRHPLLVCGTLLRHVRSA